MSASEKEVYVWTKGTYSVSRSGSVDFKVVEGETSRVSSVDLCSDASTAALSSAGVLCKIAFSFFINM